MVIRTPDLVFHLGPDGRFRSVSPGAARLTGLPPARWVNRTPEEVGLAPETTRPLADAVALSQATGAPQVAVMPFPDADSAEFEAWVLPIPGNGNGKGSGAGALVAGRNITDRMRRERRAELTRQVLEGTLESVAEAVLVIDPESRIIMDCNRATEDLLGYARSELVGHSTQNIHPSEEAFLDFGRRSQVALESEGIYRGTGTMRRKDGTLVPTGHTVTLLDPDKGLEGGVVSVVRDLSERTQAERSVSRYERRLEALRAMDRAILAARSPQEIAQAAVDHLRTLLEATRVGVTLWSPVEDTPEMVVVSTEEGQGAITSPEGADALGHPPLPGMRPPGAVHVVADLAEVPVPRSPVLDQLLKRGIRTLASAALQSGSHVVGVLHACFSEPNAFGPAEADAIRETADHLSLALRQARLRELARRAYRHRIQAEERAMDLEVRLNRLLDDLNVGVLRVSTSGRILALNDAGRRLLGLGGDDGAQALHARDLLESTSQWQSLLQEVRDASPGRVLERRIRRPDGSTAWLSGRARTFYDPELDEVVVEGILQDVSRERELQQEVVDISTRERERLGRDLHDDLGQLLTGLAFLAGDLRGRLTQERHGAARDAGRLESLANSAVSRTRTLAHSGQPLLLDGRGLPTALADLAGQMEDLFGVTVEVACSPDARASSLAEAAHLFRIAQEAMTNAARHGKAQAVHLSFSDLGGSRQLTVVDNGTGFYPHKQEAGLGLRIMRYRAQSMGGTLDVMSDPGRGTEVVCTLPAGDGPNDPRTDQEAP